MPAIDVSRGALAVDTFATLSGVTTNALEVQANAFAAEFLLERLGRAGPADRLGELEAMPYLSPALHATRLGAVLRDDAPAEGALATAIARLLSPPGG